MTVALPTQDASGPGSVLAARYRVVERLGEGGMGVVYRVVDETSGATVALKTLPLRAGPDDRRLLLFKTEFWAMTRLRHPNLPEVYDFGRLEDGTPYFTMELIEGADLKDCVPLPLHRFYDVFTQLAQALSFIHARRLVHRDVKASNVRLMQDDAGTRVVLMDFGLVSALGETAARDTVSGTAAYLAPEAGHGGVLDARADLFSFGVLAAEALIGRLPRRFAQGAAPAALAASGTHVDLGGLSGHPPGLVRLLRRLVADAPSRRPPSADLVVDTLVGLSGGEDPRSGTLQKRSYLATSSLVGRDVELSRLRASLDAAREGRGGGSCSSRGPPAWASPGCSTSFGSRRCSTARTGPGARCARGRRARCSPSSRHWHRSFRPSPATPPVGSGATPPCSCPSCPPSRGTCRGSSRPPRWPIPRPRRPGCWMRSWG